MSTVVGRERNHSAMAAGRRIRDGRVTLASR